MLKINKLKHNLIQFPISPTKLPYSTTALEMEKWKACAVDLPKVMWQS